MCIISKVIRLNRKNLRDHFSLKVSSVVRTLTISDIFILSGFGLIAPIFSIFLDTKIEGANLEMVGIASMIYLLTKSLGQLPVAQVIDRLKGEDDDFWLMVIGSLATSLVPLLYLLARTPVHIYAIQFVYGLSQAMTFPSWMAIFTRHIDSDKEGVEWGAYYTLTDLFGAGAAAIGGAVAYHLGFAPLFVVVSVMSFFGSGWLLLVRKNMRE